MLFFRMRKGSILLPVAGASVSAGFPSPAEDFTDKIIDLNRELVKNPSSTFIVRVDGHSMSNEGIKDGDLLIVDKGLPIRNNDIAVCCLDGEFTVKQVKLGMDCYWLQPAHPDYKPIRVTKENDFSIWGVVIHAIKSYRCTL